MTGSDNGSDESQEQDQGDRMERADRIRSRRGSRSRSAGSETTASDETDHPDQMAEPSQPSQSSQREKSKMSSQTEQPDKRPVKERPHRTIYLPEALDEEFETLLDTILFKAKIEADTKLGKNRHAYPLVMYVGIERAQEMSIEDLLDVLEETSMLDDPTD